MISCAHGWIHSCSVKGAKHLPIQHNAVKVALFEVFLTTSNGESAAVSYLDFSMGQLPCNESILNSVRQAVGSCQWIQEILTMCLQGIQINVILDLWYVPNVVLLHYFTNLTRIILRLGVIISCGDNDEFQSLESWSMSVVINYLLWVHEIKLCWIGLDQFPCECYTCSPQVRYVTRRPCTKYIYYQCLLVFVNHAILQMINMWTIN